MEPETGYDAVAKPRQFEMESDDQSALDKSFVVMIHTSK